ncbi:MAG: hypothetical protein O2890_00475 [Cyanobacteria bacterium]|nr:hypothetical protein [Cyanobacteriota bacterium]MDA0864906.1 hypothetical protein [Cyanobacteriota bacterium]
MQQWTRFYGWAGLFALAVAMVGITPGVTGAALEFEAASETPELISRGNYRNHRYRGTGRREVLALNRGSGRLVG